MINNSGLLPLTRDRNDYSHSGTFGSFPISELPSEYFLLSEIKNQGGRNTCTAQAACASHASQVNCEFDADWFFDREGEVAGSVNPNGYDLRTPMKTGCKVGFKPIDPTLPIDRTESYFAVDGDLDTFDNIRAALWLGKDDRQTIVGGTMWYSEWTYAPNGVVALIYKTKAGLHAIKIAGWRTINNEPFLIVQNSYGKEIGDGGLFYFPRKVVNSEFDEGLFIYREKPDPSEIKKIGLIVTLLQQMVDLFWELLGYRPSPEPIKPTPEVIDLTPKPTNPTTELPPNETSLLWDKENTRHSCRVIMDEYSLSWTQKDLLCAVIQAESGFNTQAKNVNKNGSVDYGICQINSFYWIGAGKHFASAEEVLEYPEKSVRFMVEKYLAGHLDLWCAFTNGSYKRFLR